MGKEKRQSFIEKWKKRILSPFRDRQGDADVLENDDINSTNTTDSSGINIVTHSSDEIIAAANKRMRERERPRHLLKSSDDIITKIRTVFNNRYRLRQEIDDKGVLTVVITEPNVNRVKDGVKGVYEFPLIFQPEEDPDRPGETLYDDMEIHYQFDAQRLKPKFVSIE
jgi:hypothetical protein